MLTPTLEDMHRYAHALYNNLDGPQIIDTRPEEDFDSRHIIKSINLPHTKLLSCLMSPKELSKVFLKHGVDTTLTSILIGDGLSEFIVELALKEVGCEKTGIFFGGWEAYAS